LQSHLGFFTINLRVSRAHTPLYERRSHETKKKLAQAESDVLSGASPYITISELTDNMTALVVDRLATLTDEEIQWATEASTDKNSQIRSRAAGKWGVLTKKDLVQQAKAGRLWRS
jgi:hypothetical protein